MSKIVRIESGAVGLTTTDLRALLSLYDITDKVYIEDLVAAAREARQAPWWKKDFGDIASEQYLQFVEFEQTADEVLSFQTQFVPGILQTREYAQTILQGVIRDAAPDHLAALLAFRLERQRLLQAKQPPRMSFVLDEPVVWRRVGSADVMAGQVSHLIELAQSPHISIRILRFTAGITPGMQTPFVLMRFPDPADPPVLYFEAPRSDTVVLDDNAEIKRYSRTFEHLQQMSLSEGETIEFLKNLGGRQA